MTKQHAAAAASGSASAGREREASAMRDWRGGTSPNQDEQPTPVAVPAQLPARSMRLPERRTALERLMTEMRVDVDAVAMQRGASEDNQQVAEDYADVSLELLALLSPHGTTQQWEEDEENDGYIDTKDGEAEQYAKRLSMLARVDLAEYSGHSKSQRHAPPPDLTSPTQHMVPFQASPTHSAHGNEFDLASPVALPDSPQSQQLPWSGDDLALDYDAREVRGAHDAPKDSVTLVEDGILEVSHASPSTIARRSAPMSSRRSPLPSHTPLRTPGKAAASGNDAKPKARHGGIYSLLLKNKPPEHEPMLVDEKRSPLGPEVSPSLHSASKRASPPSFAKLQHGGIYSLLRRNSKGSD